MGIKYRQFLNDEDSSANALSAVGVDSDFAVQEGYASLDLTITFVSCSAVGHFNLDIWLHKDEDKEGDNLKRIANAENKLARLRTAIEMAEESIEQFRDQVIDKDGNVKFKKAKKKKKQT